MTNPLLPRPARTAGRILVWMLLILLVLVAAAVVWLGVRASLAASHLRAAESTARSVAADIDDPATVSERLPAIARETAAARSLTSDPVWAAAEGLPWIGDQLSAVGVVTAALDEVAGTALVPLIDVASDFSLDALRPVDGRFDLTGLTDLKPAAEAGAAEIGRAAEAVDGIDLGGVLPPLAESVADISALLHTVHDGADAVARATALMPRMLGQEGPRNYLVVFQNNAEWRSLGGIVGAMAVIHTDDGAISLSAQGSSSDFTKYTDPVLDIGEELAAITAGKPAQWIQNATQVPEFPLAARVSAEMWARETGTQVDGVLSLDPVALSYLLEATGPVALPSGDVLTGENATQLLLNDVYQRYERPADQDAFFELAAAAVFAALSDGSTDPGALVSGLARAGEEHRLLIWNADEAEQAILDGTTLQGGLPVTDAEQTSFGVYLNDGTGSKMDYYMHVGTDVQWCTGTTGAQEAALLVRLRDDAPADAADLPSYITGGGGFGTPAGVTNTVAYLYLPRGSELVSATATGGGPTPGFSTASDRDHPVLTWATDLRPGEEATALIRVRTPVTDSLLVRATPVIPGTSATLEGACAGLG
ncbi:DUF4012 domain-containing protein [Microbacterium caowuchunii]|uniref:DUF4012 domain-containing protein n=1 Tax=Microbacterium caowuchunii TaxID=2614638 RepID=A0A5N0TFQ9_9MICO|nr:DUF4012 domain-containing protein [Microbacterium caowuchunii]KAA9133870.1 DUF4012 domain-containing protein [Microbacterium caowuchunii]